MGNRRAELKEERGPRMKGGVHLWDRTERNKSKVSEDRGEYRQI